MSERSRYAAAFLLFGVVGAGADWLSDRFERSDTQETALSKGASSILKLADLLGLLRPVVQP